MLEVLFDIERDAINRDLRRAEEDIPAIANEISSLFALPLTARTPKTDARLAHLLLVQAHEFCRGEAIAPELKTFHAAFAAGHVVQDAEMVAADKGTCAELSSRMDAIRRREGLADDEFWVKQDEGPQDYRELNDEFGRVLEGVEDTIFAFVLRRYHMNEVADLFERNRVAFEIQREVGRRVISPPRRDTEDIEKQMDEYFRGEYGADALQRVQSRANELRDKDA
jgi:hypothetical protein